MLIPVPAERSVSVVYLILVSMDARKYQHYMVVITLCRCNEVIFLYTIAIKTWPGTSAQLPPKEIFGAQECILEPFEAALFQ